MLVLTVTVHITMYCYMKRLDELLYLFTLCWFICLWSFTMNNSQAGLGNVCACYKLWHECIFYCAFSNDTLVYIWRYIYSSTSRYYMLVVKCFADNICNWTAGCIIYLLLYLSFLFLLFTQVSVIAELVIDHEMQLNWKYFGLKYPGQWSLP